MKNLISKRVLSLALGLAIIFAVLATAALAGGPLFLQEFRSRSRG